jgi:putative component of membrane protein insertase Oxa1/YidC/SpoIIIJ protein YidD
MVLTHGIIRIIIILAAAALVSACAHSQSEHQHAEGSGFYNAVVNIYTGPLNHLSAVRRGVCPMHPSCSQYSRQAVARYGPVTGWIMTMDRLLRCGRDELATAPRVFVDGDWKYFDPVEWNAPLPEKAAIKSP